MTCTKNIIFVSCLLTLASLSFGQTQDTVYQNRIEKFTTDERFYPSSVTKIYHHSSIPSPLDHFGTIIGAPGVMHRTSEIFGYYKKLAESSSKVLMEQVGTSEEGRPIYLVSISSEENIQNLDKYKQALDQLADPRKTDRKTADELIKNGLPVYYLNGGLHSPEMGSPEMLMELAYRLITDPSESIQKILNNTIVLINPVSETDGRDKQVDWYYRYTKAKTEWNDGRKGSTPYWGKYVVHDNNRDGLQVSQEVSKAIKNIYMDWHPTVMLDLHESVPLLYISTGTGPYNENVDPITVGEWQTIANQEMVSLAAQGLPGTFTWAFYDGWWPGYGIWVANTHNSIGRFYETFGNAGANTFLRDINSKYAGDEATSREWYRPDPATRMVYWSARNNINYMQAAVLASLDYTADNGTTLLSNFYQKGINNTKTGEKGKIKMFTIPTDQRDPAMMAYLLNQLRVQEIEIHKASNGEYVVLLDQPYSKLAVDLLTRQNYPQDAKFPPYDAIAWTFNYLYGVEVNALDSMKYQKEDLSLLTSDVVAEAKVSGEGVDYFMPYKAQFGVISALYEASKMGKKVSTHILDQATVIGSDTLEAGALVFRGISKQQADNLASKYALDLIASSQKPDNLRALTLPRVAIYHSWFDTQAEGWVRFTFEQKNIPYTSIDKDDLKAGKLNSKFDIIVIPHMRGDNVALTQGVSDKFGPMPFTKTDEFPSHGYPDSTPDMTGGPGYSGIANLEAFVKNGGILVPLENSAASIADLGLSTEISSFQPSGLFHPGSVVTVKKTDEHNPILYGYPNTFHVFKGNGKLLNTALYNRHMKILQYGTETLADEKPYKGDILGGAKMDEAAKEKLTKTEPKPEKKDPYVLSGMVRNEKSIIGHGAIFNVPVEKGRVVFFTFNPLHRYLNHHDSGMFWNVLINWNHLDN